jgi:asparagine synthase (glutamine-hydrolysing)
MSAIWGILGTPDGISLGEVGRRLQHRGIRERHWTPAPNVQFVWRQDDGVPASIGPPSVPLMFTGVIGNREELGARLGDLTGDCCARNDAELLWELYRVYGANGFALVNGQFAVALYDASAKELLLAADRWAAQPLYVARLPNGWAFATEYRALLALPQLELSIDPQAVAALTDTKYLPARKSLLVDVHPVAPGEIIRISQQVHEHQPYTPLSLQVSPRFSERDLASGLRASLLASTRTITQGQDRIGIALSAGLDSTLTLGLVRAVAPHALIHTYTVSFDPRDPDLALAAESARYFNTIHRQIVLGPGDLPRRLPELVWAMEDPCAREEMLMYHVLAQEAASEVPLILYGHMADVLFAGMPRHLLIKLAAKAPFARGPLVEFYDYTQMASAPRSILGRLLTAVYFRGRKLPPARVTGASGRRPETGLHLSPVEPLNCALLAALRHPTEVAAIERLHARAGVRFASVFHDTRVAEWAFRVPDRLKIRGRCRKYILRRAADGVLPQSLARRKKGMIRIPLDGPFRYVIDEMAAELLAPEIVAKRGLFDPRDLTRLLQHWRTEEEFYRIWTLLLIELWCRTFIDGRGGACHAMPRSLRTATSYSRDERQPACDVRT